MLFYFQVHGLAERIQSTIHRGSLGSEGRNRTSSVGSGSHPSVTITQAENDHKRAEVSPSRTQSPSKATGLHPLVKTTTSGRKSRQNSGWRLVAPARWFFNFISNFSGLEHDRLDHPRLSHVRQSITGLLFKSHSQGSRLSIASVAQAIDINTVKVCFLGEPVIHLLSLVCFFDEITFP